jgi:23S rRNA (pseudouridine1915-N3)-methyltransferase
VRAEKEEGKLPPETIKAREGERLRAQITPKSYLVALDPRGKEFTTEEFAAWLTVREQEARPLTFLIGGHLGLDAAILAQAHERLALSRLTLTHELSRLILLEQLYRAGTIKAGHPYHV